MRRNRSAIWTPYAVLAVSLLACVATLTRIARGAGAPAAWDRSAGIEFFEQRIRPVLADRCYKCHSAEAAQNKKLKGRLRLDTREGLLKAGESGKPAVVPGDAEHSLLIEAIRYRNEDLQMPPKQRLTDAQVADFVAWVGMGAPDPRGEPSSTIAVAARPDPKQFWSFQPVKDPPIPEVRDRAWVRTPVDAFILSKLEAKDLSPSPVADRRTLIRRASYDLTGLPPAANEVDAFVKDDAPDAYDRLIDRLLASPRYGERWGRYWLDLARYSDTKGYVFDREERFFVHAHAYRDWVIRAFNDDLPYDQFLLRQVAADQLAPRPVAVKDGVDQDLAAMGFLTGGRRFLGVTPDIIDDRMDVMMRTMQGLTIGCARCHDHKFDPIPTRDYYSLYGVFAGSRERTVVLDPTPAKTPEYVAYEAELKKRTEKFESTFAKRREEAADHFRNKSSMYLPAVLEVEKLPTELFGMTLGPDDFNPVIARQWQAYLFRSSKRPFDPIFAPWHAMAALPPAEFSSRAPEIIQKLTADDAPNRPNPHVAAALKASPPASMLDLAKLYGRLLDDVDRAWRQLAKTSADAKALPDADQEALRQVLYGPDSACKLPPGSVAELELFFDEPRRVELFKLQGEVDRWNISAPGAPDHALILVDRDEQTNPRVFKRGNAATRGEEVPRQFLEILSGPGRKPFEHGSGRLEMARLIASRDNPLTARVMVNRIWQHHFGEEIVRTPSDFGTRADPPSHPQLLDWLATRFMNEGWSVKKIHRLIMLSSAYRQASVRPVDSAGDEAAKGASVDPENRLLWRMNRQRLDFEAMRDSLLAVTGELDLTAGGRPVELFKPPFATRRTVYGLVDRQYLPGVFRVFDFANPDLHAPERSGTTVPQQALFFLNHPFVLDRARGLMKRPEVASEGDPAERVRRMYRAVYQREPTPRQVEAAVQFVGSLPEDPPPAPTFKPTAPEWQYGFGEFDEASQKVKGFTVLPHFTGDAWQGGPSWPDGKLGWVRLNADGGHAGNDPQHAAIRRWTAPRDMTVTIEGTIRHEHPEGDGVRCRIVAGREGQLAMFLLHNRSAEAKVGPVKLKKGETIDFAVSIAKTLNNNDFTWAPIIKVAGSPAGASAAERVAWDAKSDFGGPAVDPVKPLTAWEKYAQVLLLSNEFMFVD